MPVDGAVVPEGPVAGAVLGWALGVAGAGSVTPAAGSVAARGGMQPATSEERRR